jgi:hypothetical protein
MPGEGQPPMPALAQGPGRSLKLSRAEFHLRFKSGLAFIVRRFALPPTIASRALQTDAQFFPLPRSFPVQ